MWLPGCAADVKSGACFNIGMLSYQCRDYQHTNETVSSSSYPIIGKTVFILKQEPEHAGCGMCHDVHKSASLHRIFITNLYKGYTLYTFLSKCLALDCWIEHIFPCIGSPTMKIRQSWDGFILMLGFTIPVNVIYILLHVPVPTITLR